MIVLSNTDECNNNSNKFNYVNRMHNVNVSDNDFNNIITRDLLKFS